MAMAVYRDDRSSISYDRSAHPLVHSKVCTGRAVAYRGACIMLSQLIYTQEYETGKRNRQPSVRCICKITCSASGPPEGKQWILNGPQHLGNAMVTNL